MWVTVRLWEQSVDDDSRKRDGRQESNGALRFEAGGVAAQIREWICRVTEYAAEKWAQTGSQSDGVAVPWAIESSLVQQ
jgi:hypothetical protein